MPNETAWEQMFCTRCSLAPGSEADIPSGNGNALQRKVVATVHRQEPDGHLVVVTHHANCPALASHLAAVSA